MKKAIVTGVTGQDGAYLTRYLLEQGYNVVGLKRRTSLFNTARIDDIFEEYLESGRFKYYYFDLADFASICSILQKEEPDEIYNLAAQSHVKVSFDVPEYTANTDGIGTLRFLEAIRILGLKDKTRFYQASTSELYGKVVETPQSEETPFYPRSPYGVAKLYGYWIVKNYREAYGIHASNGILFNHESPLRGETFVTRKITRGLSRVFTSGKGELTLGNLDSVRDWGHAKDYVRAMHLIANHKVPSDWVVSTGVGVTVREFVKKCALYCGVELESEGNGDSEILSVKAVINSKWESILSGIHPPVIGQVIVRVDPKFYRPTEVELLIGDSTKIRKELGWNNEYSVDDLLKDMMSSDLNSALKTTFIKAHGFRENQSLEDIL